MQFIVYNIFTVTSISFFNEPFNMKIKNNIAPLVIDSLVLIWYDFIFIISYMSYIYVIYILIYNI